MVVQLFAHSYLWEIMIYQFQSVYIITVRIHLMDCIMVITYLSHTFIVYKMRCTIVDINNTCMYSTVQKNQMEPFS